MSEPLYDYGDMIEGERMAYERKMRSQPLDMPDGPGWWAFEGMCEGRKTKDVCEVFMFYERLTAWVLRRGITATSNMQGKWYRLTMPWEQPQPAIPPDVRETLRGALQLSGGYLSGDIPPYSSKWGLTDIDAALTWLDAQQGGRNG